MGGNGSYLMWEYFWMGSQAILRTLFFDIFDVSPPHPPYTPPHPPYAPVNVDLHPTPPNPGKCGLAPHPTPPPQGPTPRPGVGGGVGCKSTFTGVRGGWGASPHLPPSPPPGPSSQVRCGRIKTSFWELPAAARRSPRIGIIMVMDRGSGPPYHTRRGSG